MARVEGQTFSCPECGRRFGWKAQFAGRSVRCRCGVTFEAVPDAVALPEPLAVADDPPAAAAGSSGGAQTAAHVLPVASSASHGSRASHASHESHASRGSAEYAPASPARSAAGDGGSARVIPEQTLRNLPYPLHTRRVQDMATDEDERSLLRDLYAPTALLVIGLAARFSQVMFFASQQSLSRPAAVGLLACELVIGAIALLGGAAAAAGMMSTTFGDARLAVLKVLGIAVATSAAAYFAASFDREPWGVRGMVMAWHIVLLMYFVLFTWLFKLDLQEGLMTTVIVMAIQLLLLFAISRALSGDAARALFYG